MDYQTNLKSNFKAFLSLNHFIIYIFHVIHILILINLLNFQIFIQIR